MSIEYDNVHPDEGTIHAWLDGALGAEDSARIEAHAAGCATCAAAVAEARGLIAGASRIVASLDDAPARLVQVAPSVARPVIPQAPARESSMWRFLRVTPARAAIAASIIVAVGVILTRQRVSVDGAVGKTLTSGTPARDTLAVAANPTPDSLLSSAIVAKLRQDQPAPVMSRGKGESVPTAPASSGLAVDETAPRRVAAARASLDAQRDSSVPADRARVGFALPPASGNATALQQMSVAGIAAENAGAIAARSAPLTAPAALETAGKCYRVETTDPKGAAWGEVSLPVVLAFDATGRMAQVYGADGKPTDERTAAIAASPDSLSMRLLRIGYSGTIHLGAGADMRSGMLQSSQAQMRLEEVVTTGLPTASDASSRRADQQREQRAPAAAPAPLRKTLVAPPSSGTAVSVSKVSCPSR